MIVVEDRKIMEAITQGIKISSVTRIMIKDFKNIKILRLKSFKEKNLDSEFKKIITKYQNKSYNFKGAMLSILGKDISSNENSFFCSQLVSQIYSDLGIKLLDKENIHVTPNDFLELKNLYDVTEEVTSKIEKIVEDRLKKNEDEIPYLDVKTTTTSTESELFVKFFYQVNIYLKKYKIAEVYNMLDLILTIRNNPLIKTFDSDICNIYNNVGLVNNSKNIDKETSTIDCDIDILIKEIEENDLSFLFSEKLHNEHMIKSRRKQQEEHFKAVVQTLKEYILNDIKFSNHVSIYYLAHYQISKSIDNCLKERLKLIDIEIEKEIAKKEKENGN